MAYLGPPPSQKLATPTSQYFSGNGSATAFTLNRPVNVAEDLNVFVNNVAQQPGSGKSYTATGTTLTFDAAPDAGTNNVYVVYRGLAEPTTRLEHPSGQPIAATTGTFSGAVSMGANNITFSNGNGIDFSATAGSGATSSILDDYEEGNWTPQFGGSSTTGTGTYSTTVGRYVKVGKKVNCWGIIVSSGTHNGTGTLQIHGLPFTKENTYLSWGTETNIAYHFGFTSYGSFTNVIRLLGPVSNGTYIRFHAFGNTGDTSVPPTPANVQSGTSVYFSATYEVQ